MKYGEFQKIFVMAHFMLYKLAQVLCSLCCQSQGTQTQTTP